jgi:RNA polymerase sigma-70 factor (ECF subfamily)
MQGMSCAENSLYRSTTGVFPGTHWSVVLAAGGEAGNAALAELCGTYWYPIYAFARRQGYQPADAEDLAQSFFAHLIEARLVEKADPRRGRFRSFLLACFTHFMESQKTCSRAMKRGGACPVIPMDPQEVERRLSREPAQGATPERLYDRNWAQAVLDEALDRLEAEFKTSGRGPLFEQLQPFLQGDVSGPNYSEVAKNLGTTEATIKVTVHRMRERYRTLLRTAVSQTVNDPMETDLELAHLMAALRG